MGTGRFRQQVFTGARVDGYLRAEARCPDARDAEGDAFLGAVGALDRSSVLELGSGTGFLTTRMARSGAVVETIDAAFDRPEASRRHARFDLRDGFPRDYSDSLYGAVVSLAVLHHVAASDDRAPPVELLRSVRGVLLLGGRFVVGDVSSFDEDLPAEFDASRRVGRFFHEVIDRHSQPPHHGAYLKAQATLARLREVGFVDVRHRALSTPWRFASRRVMGVYLQTLFNLSMDPSEVAARAESLIGLRLTTTRGVELLWALQCFEATRRQTIDAGSYSEARSP